MIRRGFGRGRYFELAALSMIVAVGVGCRSHERQRSKAPDPSLNKRSARAQPSEARREVAPGPSEDELARPAASAAETAAPRVPVLAVVDPTTLSYLDAHGFDLGSTAFEGPARRASELAETRGWQRLVEVLRRDLVMDRQRDSRAGVGMRYAHRQFDARWLTSDQAHFELVGVVNRIDRRAFEPTTCGELRFIYRLAYRAEVEAGDQPIESRLPMTVNVVEYLDDDGARCREVAARWMRPENESGQPERKWLLGEGGPLSADALENTSPKSVEVNVQSVRWPSTVRPNMAGHAEYILRVFVPGDGFAPSRLENTIDVSRLRRDPASRKELVQYLRQKETMAAIDEGTVVVPERFLARRVVSVTPHGFARLANRPYTSTLAESAFDGVDWSRYETFASARSLLRRLDGLACNGCHQSRSLAGFHFLGLEPSTKRVDALATAGSPHFRRELARRVFYMKALEADEPPDDRRPPAERIFDDGRSGALCGLGDPGFSSWTCRDGLTCTELVDPQVGTCLPEQGEVGGPCEYGPMDESQNRHRDFVRLMKKRTCAGDRVCEKNAVGFPAGMCAGPCTDLDQHAVCGGIALLDPFNACIARGQPFTECIQRHTRPGALATCSDTNPCRPDYVCARHPDGGGMCLPPYFLFQLRVDGHRL